MSEIISKPSLHSVPSYKSACHSMLIPESQTIGVSTNLECTSSGLAPYAVQPILISVRANLPLRFLQSYLRDRATGSPLDLAASESLSNDLQLISLLFEGRIGSDSDRVSSSDSTRYIGKLVPRSHTTDTPIMASKIGLASEIGMSSTEVAPACCVASSCCQRLADAIRQNYARSSK